MNSINGGLALSPEILESAPRSKSLTASISDLRLPQDFENMVNVEEVVTSVSIGKPNWQTYFRVHPEWSDCYPIFAKKQDGEADDLYIVNTKAVPELAPEVTRRLLVPLITRAGSLYIWALRLGTPEKEVDLAAKSAYAAMLKAKTAWVRIKWNGREFKCSEAKSKLSEPEWPDTTFNEMLNIAFAEKVIDHADHPVVKAFNGEC